MQIAAGHWAMALSAAALVHAVVATTVLWQPLDSGAKSAGIGGIEVSLGLAGGAPGNLASTALEVPEAEMVAPAEATTESPIQEVTATPPDPATSERVEPIETETATPTEFLVDATPMETAEVAVQGETPAPQPVKEASAVEVAEAVLVEEDVDVAKRQLPVEDTRAQRPAPVAEQMAAVAPSMPGTSGKAGTQTSPNAGSANDTSGGGIPGETVAYMALLQAWLEKHKEYPKQARMTRQEGIAILSFSLGRKGQLLESELKRSTGYGLLDTAAIRMVQRAEPFPPIPENLDRNRVDVTVPVYFSLD